MKGKKLMTISWSPSVTASDLWPPVSHLRRGLFDRFLGHPLSRIVVAILFLAPVIILNNVFSFLVLDKLEEPVLSLVQIPKAVLFVVLLTLVYRLFIKYAEHRKPFELSVRTWYQEFGAGMAIGGGMVALIVGILFALGAYEIVSFNDPVILLTRFFRYGQGSFIEELLFTVIIFRLIEEFAGTLVSYLVVSLTFGLLHLGNDNATIITSLFISAQEITLLVPFILTRRIWMSWAVHLSWNYSQSAVFGLNNSGMEHGGFISAQVQGSGLLTGGTFGIEASLLGMIVNLSVGLLLFLFARHYQQFAAPRWRRVSEN